MDKDLLCEFEKKLKEQRSSIEKELKRFAKKDKKLEHDWDTVFPHADSESGGGLLERASDEVEEYSALLPLEFNLETRLKNIDSALKKIKGGKFGICEKCDGNISKKRLEFHPEAKFCQKCLKK